MRVIALALLVGVALAVPTQPHFGERLLQFNGTSQRWVTEKELDAILMRDSDCPGFFDITEHQHLSPRSGFRPAAMPTAVSQSPTVKTLISSLSADRIIDTVTALTNFKSRYYKSATGAATPEFLLAEYEKIALAKGRSDVSVSLFPHAWPQSSVIVRVEGSGENKHEVVVLGSHIDSINPADLTGADSPGSDDDASGTGTVLEVFRTLINSGFKPDRTIEFHGYSAEEVGLRGSQDVVAAYQKNNVNVVSMLQLDMTLYQAGNNNKLAFVTDYVSSNLTQFLRTLVDEYCAVEWQNTKCGYACSDHASWNKAGYTSAFPFETLFQDHNPDIHTTKDLVRNLNKEHGLEYAKLALAYVVELAGQN